LKIGLKLEIKYIDNIRTSAKFSESILLSVWKESRLRGESKCTKPKMGMEMAKRCSSVSDIPNEIKQIFDKARSISCVI
jgi:hypothetical protein